jgi:hypothetical protein
LEKENKRLLEREREQAKLISKLQGELVKQERELAKYISKLEGNVTDLENELEKQKVLESERTEKREKDRAHEVQRQNRLTGALYRILAANIVQPSASMTKTLPASVQGTNAQMVVDFLNDVRYILSLHDLELLPARGQFRYLITVIFSSRTREKEPYTFSPKLPKRLKCSLKPLNSPVCNVI